MTIIILTATSVFSFAQEITVSNVNDDACTAKVRLYANSGVSGGTCSDFYYQFNITSGGTPQSFPVPYYFNLTTCSSYVVSSSAFWTFPFGGCIPSTGFFSQADVTILGGGPTVTVGDGVCAPTSASTATCGLSTHNVCVSWIRNAGGTISLEIFSCP